MKASLVRAVPALQLFAEEFAEELRWRDLPGLPGLPRSAIHLATIQDPAGDSWEAWEIPLQGLDTWTGTHHMRLAEPEWTEFLRDPQGWSDRTNSDGVIGIADKRMFTKDQDSRRALLHTTEQPIYIVGDRHLLHFVPV